MVYISTRGGDESVSASRAIMQGICKNGGLFVPNEIPNVTFDDLKGLCFMSYTERAKYILSRYLNDFSDDEVADCVEKAYTEKAFCKDIAPVVNIGGSENILELWHGPTCAFKDMALQILPHLLTTSLKKNNEQRRALILVATSGDTGKAALEGFADVPGTGIMVFYPENGVSRIQKKQMTTQTGENVNVCAIKGNFDDAQTGVKSIFANGRVAEKLNEKGAFLSSANSINWGRLLPQIVYYFHGYCSMVSMGKIKCGEKINITVPTGNFGNILAAYYAYRMGLPVNKFICASNKNKVLTDFINTGVYDKRREFYLTSSPSMDILISSNLERMLFYITGSSERVASLMKDLNEKGVYKLNETETASLKEIFDCGSCDDENTIAQINKTYKNSGYTLDTHTAVAVNVYENYVDRTGDKTPCLIASTASPFKFASNVLKGFDIAPDEDEFKNLETLEKSSGIFCPENLRGLKERKERFTLSCSKTQMEEKLFDFVNM